jgi:Ca-activated chloride channel family protein
MKLTTFACLAALTTLTTMASVWNWVPVPTASAAVDTSAAPETASTASVAAAQSFSSSFEAGTTLHLEGRVGHPVIANTGQRESLLFFEVRADGSRASVTAPVDLAVVLDRSGSMKGRRMANAIAAAHRAIADLKDGDTVSVVAYDDDAQVVVAPTTIDSGNRAAVSAALANVRARGRTCVSCGLEAAMRLMSGERKGVRRMMVLSDGQANVGLVQPSSFAAFFDRARDMDVGISSIGVDLDYNEQLMLALAQQTNGRHYFVRDETGLGDVFAQEQERLAQTLATGAELTLELGPEFELVEVFDRVFRRNGSQIVIPLGAFSSGESKTVLARVMVRSGAPESILQAASARLQYADFVRDEPSACGGELSVRLSGDPSERSDIDPVVEARLTQAETARAVEEANRLFAAGEASRARGLLVTAESKVRTRRSAANKKAKGLERWRIEHAFKAQSGALERADSAFEAGIAADRAAPQASSPGRAAVKQNTAELDELRH